MSQVLCIKHNTIIQYVCALQKCPQGHLICQICKQKQAEHFSQHLNFIYVFKQLIGFQNPRSFKQLLPKLQKAVGDCENQLNNQKSLWNKQIDQINTDFNKFYQTFIDIEKKTRQTLIQAFLNDSKKYQERLQTLKTQLRQFLNKKQQQTSFFSTLFYNQEIKANNTLELIDKILNKNKDMFKIRADLLFFDRQIKKSVSRIPKYKKSQKAKQKMIQMHKSFQSLIKKTYSQFNELFNEDQMKRSMVGELRKSSVALNTENLTDNQSLYQSKASTSSQKNINSATSLNQRNQNPPNLVKTTYPSLHPTIASILQSLDPMPSNSLNLKEQGPYKYQEGIYIGNYNNRLRHGKGKFIFNDGTYYEGYWRNDAMFGVGRLITKTFYYQGQINEGKAEGNGRMQDSQKIYNGQWFNDMKHGQGRLQYKNGKIKYSGSFQNNLFHGNGILQFGEWRYEGGFWAGQKSGEGYIRYTNGQMFTGKFRSDLKLYGKFIWPDGSYYQGTFEKDLPHGTGLYCWADGTFYEGTWKLGEQHGIGRELYIDGKQRKGEWQNGEWKRWI